MSALPIAQALRLVAALQDINVNYVIPLHCTGEPFYEMAKVEMPNK
jgi:7,8-dihydropterin-6-yl-methyl-4-(beta-D-ribofuranosyl)aminobenzene 5'-phosphate synthase